MLSIYQLLMMMLLLLLGCLLWLIIPLLMGRLVVANALERAVR
jgi:hypothetical protein